MNFTMESAINKARKAIFYPYNPMPTCTSKPQDSQQTGFGKSKELSAFDLIWNREAQICVVLFA